MQKNQTKETVAKKIFCKNMRKEKEETEVEQGREKVGNIQDGEEDERGKGKIR